MTQKKLKYLEVMWATQAPDVYDGPNCDQFRPDWRTNELGSGEVDTGGQGILELDAKNFPAGTKIVISVPLCPDCEESSDLAHYKVPGEPGKCDCGFDWNEWTSIEFS
jgi:hypothetical protein